MKKIKQEKNVSLKSVEKKSSELLLVLVRIAGDVKIDEDIKNTLNRLKLKRKYSCVIFHNKKDVFGMLKKVKYYIAYGEIDRETLASLIKSRGKSIDGNKKSIKIDAEVISKEIIDGKKLNDFGLKSFFRLHPPRKGIKSKLQYPKGVLGDNGKDINKLIERML